MYASLFLPRLTDKLTICIGATGVSGSGMGVVECLVRETV